MNKIWADRLVAGTRTWDEVPKSRKDAVMDILADMVEKGKLTQERFDEITAE